MSLQKRVFTGLCSIYLAKVPTEPVQIYSTKSSIIVDVFLRNESWHSCIERIFLVYGCKNTKNYSFFYQIAKVPMITMYFYASTECIWQKYLFTVSQTKDIIYTYSSWSTHISENTIIQTFVTYRIIYKLHFNIQNGEYSISSPKGTCSKIN